MKITTKIEDKGEYTAWLSLMFTDDDHQTWILEGLATQKAANQFIAEMARLNRLDDKTKSVSGNGSC